MTNDERDDYLEFLEAITTIGELTDDDRIDREIETIIDVFDRLCGHSMTVPTTVEGVRQEIRRDAERTGLDISTYWETFRSHFEDGLSIPESWGRTLNDLEHDRRRAKVLNGTDVPELTKWNDSGWRVSDR